MKFCRGIRLLQART